MKTVKIELELRADTLAQLKAMVAHSTGVCADDMRGAWGLEGTLAYILDSVADGWRRSGSWEREMLMMMGLAGGSDTSPDDVQVKMGRKKPSF